MSIVALMAVFVQFCCRFASALCSLAQEKQSVSVLRTHFINTREMRLSHSAGWQGGRGSE
jgi:hypothetical protein